ncbi:DinB family protein [Tenuibacillus multivorans]|uniref:Uncharacterized damage-inducible protein DinB (Forms a four-helix bundle) n=1 Tax=Tenuibacillus multivorans TaxID=237069 RepID=A0A1H0DVZ8_9BACI|nr:DinB family protein [Tenuibacillus multivorans]GEL76760.1 DNA damage-inducible protein DinB [Tenuibacillus multivorans]SDN74259.1 Uncharacterized damage-inducible protein DinB (forms a four-helix bundle) [Tenuibacillus multivorans]
MGLYDIKSLFEYNWTIREKWFDWCRDLSSKELQKERKGGMKGILPTLFHIIDVENRWLRGLAKDEPRTHNFEDYHTLDALIELSEETKAYTLKFLNHYNTSKLKTDILHGVNKQGEEVSYFYIEVLLHVAVHETHHIGQLSVWAREMEMEPVSANLIGLNLFN